MSHDAKARAFWAAAATAVCVFLGWGLPALLLVLCLAGSALAGLAVAQLNLIWARSNRWGSDAWEDRQGN